MTLTGLVNVPDEALEHLLRVIHRGQLETPITAPGLALAGLQGHSDSLLASLRGLDARAIQRLVAVLVAERRAAREGRMATRHS